MAEDDLDSAVETINKLTGKDEKKLLTLAKKNLTVSRQSRLQFERQWYMNMAFYFGRQWAQWTPSINGFSQLKTPAAPPWRVRLISNKIRPIIRTEHAKVIKERPQPFVIPRSEEEEDLYAAQAGEQIFEYHWQELNFNRQIRRAMFWACITGNGFIKDWYERDAKSFDDVQGMVQIEPVSPFHIFVPDMQEEELENQPYVIHSVAKNSDWIKSKFPQEKAAKLKADTAAGPDALEQKFFSALGITTPPKSHTSIHECWIKPTKDYPEGAVITWAGDMVLQFQEGWPYQHKEYPFTKFDHIPTGRFYADSTVPDLIPLQKEYNRTRSQIIEAKNRMSKPQLLAPRGSVDPKKITSEPGLVITYTPGFEKPQPLPLQNLPPYVIDEQDRIQRDMDDISSQHEVTKGRTPPGVTAATAISYLQEEDDSKLAATISSLEEGVEKIGRHTLSHVQEFWANERLIRVMGLNGMYEAYYFSGADLAGNTDLRVEHGSAIPRSRAAKQAFITELGKMGWIPPDRALRYLDMAETGKLYEEMHIDTRQAQRENMRMAESGQPMSTNDWDNHELHILEHNNYRKSQKFETLPDEIKQAFQQHVDEHKGILQQSVIQNPEQIEEMAQAMKEGGDPLSNGEPNSAPVEGGGGAGGEVVPQ